MLWGIPTELLTASGLLALGILMIMRGALVPKKFYDERVSESQRWQHAYEIQRERSDKLDAQTELLLEQGKATHALITAVFSNSAAIRQAGERNVAS